MHPFIVNDETKRMVVDNITYMLNNFLRCSEYDYIIFCWVMHKESIIGEILEALEEKYELYKVTLYCTEKALRDRLEYDVNENIRDREVIERSVQRLSIYEDMNTLKVDVSDKSVHLVADEIIRTLEDSHGKHSTN